MKPTKEMIDAARRLFKAKAWVETVKPVVENYQHVILEHLQAKDKYTGEVILDLNRTYKMNDSDFADYLELCNYARKFVGLHVRNDDYCPLLVAEELVRVRERELIKSVEPITKLTKDDILCAKNGLEKYNEFVDLTLRYCASAM